MEPDKRLLLYRIESKRSDPAIVGGSHLSVNAGAGSAEAQPALGNIAMSETNFTNSHFIPAFSFSGQSGSIVPYNFESLQFILLEFVDATLFHRDLHLLPRRINAVEVREKQSPSVTTAYYYTVSLHIQLVFGIDIFGFSENVHVYIKPRKLIRLDGREPRIPR